MSTSIGPSLGRRLPRVHSKLQLQVLALYRKCLRAAIAKPEEQRLQTVHYVQAEFRKSASSIAMKDFIRIEYLLRRGQRQLAAFAKPEVSVVQLISAPRSG
jgi:succinate dehydrogenase assembly factor 1